MGQYSGNNELSRAAALTAAVLALTFCNTINASIAGNFAERHPRRAEVLRRDGAINRRINRDAGRLDGRRGQLTREDAGIRRQEQKDALANGGHITKGEQNQLNREENGLNRQINRDSSLGRSSFQENHPRRAEVLGRDNSLNGRINADYGKLGGNYGKLENKDLAIRRQEQSDAYKNGGFITAGQQKQLNSEENNLNRKIKKDYQ